MRFYLFLSGEHPELPLAEARAALAAEEVRGPIRRPHARLALLDTASPQPRIRRAFARLALTHDAGVVLATGGYAERELRRAWRKRLPSSARIAARAERLAATTPWRRPEAEGIVGRLADRRVDLRSPTAVLRAFLLRDRVVVGWRWFDREPQAIAARHVARRPYSSPVSLEPRWARVLLNLADLRRGQTVVDPFCGTGGILLEAAAMGFRALGSDRDPEMVQGARRNLRHFGYPDGSVAAADIEESPEAYRSLGIRSVDAIVSDLPYGRSASTGREARRRLYARSARVWPKLLRPGGRLVVGVPDRRDVPVVGRGLRKKGLYEVRVHGSLTRRFGVFERPQYKRGR